MSDSKSVTEEKETKTVANEKVKQKRKFEWTEKRKEAFERCQAAKKRQLESKTEPSSSTKSENPEFS